MEKKSKTVKMQPMTNESKEGNVENQEQKLTYEQLEQVATNLHEQCRKLYEDLKEARSIISNFNDVGMLLTILEKSEYFDEPFVSRCADKIQSVVTGFLDASDKREQQLKEAQEKQDNE